MQEQDAKPNNLIESVDLNEQTIDQTLIPNQSQFLPQYLNIMQITNIEKLNKCRQQYFKVLSSNDPNFDPNGNQELQFHVMNSTKNYEYLQLNVRYNRFLQQVSLLNISQESSNHKIQKFHKGNFSTVYHTIHCDKNIAIKCIRFSNKTFLKVFKDTLLQYLTFLMAIYFDAGPRVNLMFGFHLLVFKNCIEFTMEFCNHKLKMDTLNKDLKTALANMHALKIIHFDIKPQNICFSQQLNRNVFIDFGLHRVIKEDLGQKSLTKFQGSLLFCSKQMQQCYGKGESMIDLYYNDALCLEKSIKQIEKETLKFLPEKKAKVYKQSPASVLIRIKYILSSKQDIDVNTQWYKQNFISQISKLKGYQLLEIKKFVSKLNYSENLQEKICRLNSQINNLQLKTESIMKTKFHLQFQQTSEKSQQQQENPIFKLRMNALKFLNKSQPIQTGKMPLNSCLKEYIEFLSSPNNVQKWQVNLYFQFFTQIIQLNSWKADIADKNIVCNCFNKVFLQIHQFQKLELEEKARKCFTYIGDYLDKQQTMDKNIYQITKNSFLSIILLQVYPQKQLEYFIKKLIISQDTFTRKLRVFFHILSCIQWLYYLKTSIYHYYHLKRKTFALMQGTLTTNNPKKLLEFTLFKFAAQFLSKHSRFYVKKNLIKERLAWLKNFNNFEILKLYNSTNEYDQILAQVFIYLCYQLFATYHEIMHFQQVTKLHKYKQDEELCTFSFYEFIIYLVLLENLKRYRKKAQSVIARLRPNFKCFEHLTFSLFNKTQYYCKKDSKIHFPKMNYSQFANISSLQFYCYGFNTYYYLVVKKLKVDKSKFDEQSLIENLKFRQINSFFEFLVSISKEQIFHEHCLMQKFGMIAQLVSRYVRLLGLVGRPVKMDSLKDQLSRYPQNMTCCKCKTLFHIIFFIRLYKDDFLEQDEEAVLNLIIWINKSIKSLVKLALELLAILAKKAEKYNYRRLYVQYIFQNKLQKSILQKADSKFHGEVLKYLWDKRCIVEQNGGPLYFSFMNSLQTFYFPIKQLLNTHLYRSFLQNQVSNGSLSKKKIAKMQPSTMIVNDLSLIFIVLSSTVSLHALYQLIRFSQLQQLFSLFQLTLYNNTDRQVIMNSANNNNSQKNCISCCSCFILAALFAMLILVFVQVNQYNDLNAQISRYNNPDYFSCQDVCGYYYSIYKNGQCCLYYDTRYCTDKSGCIAAITQQFFNQREKVTSLIKAYSIICGLLLVIYIVCMCQVCKKSNQNRVPLLQNYNNGNVNLSQGGSQSARRINAAYESFAYQDQQNTCCICLEQFKNEKAIILKCGHIYHSACIRDWAVKQENCPVCRSSQ